MASRRFFPYGGYYRTAPARDDDAFFFFFFPDVETVRRPAAARPSPFAYYNQPCPSRDDGSFYPGFHVRREPAATVVVKPKSSRPRSVSVPVHFAGSEFGVEVDVEAARVSVPAAADRMAHAVVDKKRELSAAEAARSSVPAAADRMAHAVVEEKRELSAAVRVQAAARGFMARRMVREVRAVELEAERVATRVAAEAEAMRGDARARAATVEELMRLLLRLDAVRGARGYRRRVTKRVLALQDAVDALERPPPPPPVTDTPPAAADGVDAKKVAALRQQSAQQREVIGALTERVDTLERAVRRAEEADRRRRRNKMLRQGKGSSKHVRGFYSD